MANTVLELLVFIPGAKEMPEHAIRACIMLTLWSGLCWIVWGGKQLIIRRLNHIQRLAKKKRYEEIQPLLERNTFS